jgi:hypothetical protein
MSVPDDAALLGPAAMVLKQAYEMDTAKRSLEALALYREGIAILMEVMKRKQIRILAAQSNSLYLQKPMY